MNLNNYRSIFKVAHRGVSSLVPENTLISFNEALKLNIDMLEIDVHRAQDGQLIIIHDPTLMRTSLQKGKIKNLTYEQLLKYDVGKWKGDQYVGERIPLLKDVLSLVKRTNKKLLIEIKSPAKYRDIELDVVNEILKSDINLNQIIIQSFNRKSLKSLKELHLPIHIGVLLKRRHRLISKSEIKNISQYAQFLNPNYKMINRKLIEQAHQYNLKVMPYTVNDDNEMKKLLELGVDGIITDEPQQLINVLSKLKHHES